MENPIRFHDLSKLSVTERHALLKRTESDLGRYIEPVERILKAVKEDGDLALVKFAREFDQAELNADAIKVQSQEFDKAVESVEDDVVEAICFAADSIRVFHEGQLPEPMRLNEVRPGVFCGEKVNPIPSVACYVPRGKGSFPSGADDHHSCGGSRRAKSLHSDAPRTGRPGG
jgi:histidinol dehydrogenase